MNVNMFTNTQTQANIAHLKGRGVAFIEPDSGPLACGWEGKGRLAHHREIFFHVRRALTARDFEGRRILISTGPTREAIDPVRFISNRSSGKMGVALAVEAFRRGAQVTLVHGPLGIPLKVPREVECVAVVSAQEMHDTVMDRTFPADRTDSPFDTVIMAAAVADYRPEVVHGQKIKKSVALQAIPILANPDILLELGKRRSDERTPHLVGFAVETGRGSPA
jgi:phosphopantothenoylcysteine decarboxylase/phosphopantothenate--cysteine ligase